MKKIMPVDPLKINDSAAFVFWIAIAVFILYSLPFKFYPVMFATPPFFSWLYQRSLARGGLTIEAAFLSLSSSATIFLCALFWALNVSIFYTLLVYILFIIFNALILIVYRKFELLFFETVCLIGLFLGTVSKM